MKICAKSRLTLVSLSTTRILRSPSTK
jgi:hypothetical protein